MNEQVTTTTTIMMETDHDDDVLHHEADDLLYLFMHPPSLVFKYRERYGLNGLQATA